MKITICALFLFFALATFSSSQLTESEKDLVQWHSFSEEIQIQKLQQQLSSVERPDRVAFVNINVLTMQNEQVLQNRMVLVSDGKIQSIQEDSEVPQGYLQIDGNRRYLLPGLVDMHVHNLESSSQHLLNIATGITTVRDMDGFDFLLKQREQAKKNELFAPNLYVTGHILNANRMGMYATVVKSPEEARRVVDEQKKEGYDFIKVHNNLPLETYKAILDEARKVNLDVVGHIPHDITVKQAIDLGQVTLEHFKGYLLDSTLTLTSEDYVSATKGSSAWNCPTLYTYRMDLRGEEAKKLVKQSAEMKYVSWLTKKDWLKEAEEAPDPVHQNVIHLEKKILKDLLPVTDRFLAGTDSGGGYPFMVPGFSLHEELRLLHESGLSNYQTLRSTTVNAAMAMKKEKEFGTIEVGKRADLLLVQKNPLQDLKTLDSPEGVVLRGHWIPKSEIDSILKQIETIYNPPAAQQVLSPPSAESIQKLQQDIMALSNKGFAFRSYQMESLQKLIKKLQP